MPKRKAGRGKRKVTAAPRPSADLEALLESWEAALLAGDHERVTAATQQLWWVRSKLPEALIRRFIAGRSRVPDLAFELLGGFAGPRAATYLRRIAESRQVSDIVRFGARRRAGWPERGEDRLRGEFLASLTDPDATLLEAVDQSMLTWPPGSEILTEVLAYLAILPVERRRALVGRAIDELGPRASWLLRALVHDADPTVARLAVEQLVRLRASDAAGAVGRLAATTGDEELRAEATVAARRLGLQVVDREATDEPFPFPDVDRALLSMVDGDGGQVIIVVRRWVTGLLTFVDVFHNDGWGIKGVFGATRASGEQIDDIVEGLEEGGIDLIEVDLAAIRGALARAVEVNAATGHGIPPEFEVWESFLHEAYPPRDDEPTLTPELDDAPYARRQDLLRAGGQLAEHPWFESWGFDVPATAAAMAGSPPPKGGRLTDRQYRPLVEQLVDGPARARFRQRLRRQAWLFERDGDDLSRDLSLATAAHLAQAEPAELVKQPFLRALIDRSVGQVVEAMLSG